VRIHVENNVEYTALLMEFRALLMEFRALFTPVAVMWGFVLTTM